MNVGVGVNLKSYIIRLFLLAFLMISVSTYGENVCPERIQTNETYSSCDSFCSNIKSKYFTNYNLHTSAGAISDNYDSYCSCLFTSNYGVNFNELPTDMIYCQYKVSKNKISASTYVSNDFLGIKDIPKSMIQLATFDKSATLGISGSPGIIFNGLYTVYVNIVHGIASFVALLLLIIITGWNLGLVIFSRMIRKLESGGGDYSQLVSSYWKSKAMMVIPAAVFFSLPIPQGNIFLSSAGVGVNSNSSNYTTDSCSKIRDKIKDIDSKLNDLQNRSATLTNEINQLRAQPTPNQDLIQEKEAELDEIQNRINLLTRERDLLDRNYQSLTNSNLCKVNNNNNKQIILDNPEELKVPLAIVMVKGFINTGFSYAERVANMSGSYIMSYVAVKISESNAITQNINNNLQKSYEKMKQDMENSLNQISSQSADCIDSSGSNVCATYQTMSRVNKSIKIQDKPQCKFVYAVIEDTCKEYNELLKLTNNNNNTATDIYQDISSVVNSIKGSLGILYPSVIPQASVYSIIKLVKNPEEYKISASLVKGYKGDPSDEIAGEEGPVTSALGFIKSAFNTASSVYSAVIAVTVNTAEMTKQELPLNAGFGFVLGQTVFITSVPPGAQIAGVVKDFIGSLANASSLFVGILGLIASKIVGPFLGIGAASVIVMIINLAKGVIAPFLGMLVGYALTMLILKIIPFLVVSFAMISRFLSYFLEVLKFVITLPFFAVAVATNQPHTFAEFFKKLLRLMFTPVLIAFAPLIVFAGIEFTFLLFYDIPTYIMLSFIPPSFIANFVAGLVSALLYFIASLISIAVAWQLSFSIIEGIFEFLSQFIGGASQSAVSAFQPIQRVVERRVVTNLL